MIIGAAPTADENVLRLDDVGALVGNVYGPGASTDNAIARWDGAGGDTLQNSNAILDDTGNISQADGTYLSTDEVRARDGDGLKLYDDSGAAGIFVNDGGKVGIGTTSPSANADLTLEGGVLCIKETTTPTADANYGKLYTKNDNKLYFQDGAGTEHEVDFV